MSFLGDLFSGKAPQINYKPGGFNAGGINASFGADGNYRVGASSSRRGLVDAGSNLYGDLGNQYGELGATVAPGYNDLLKSRLTEFDNSATKALGDLKQNLAARRIMGSSFGNDTLSRLNSTISQNRDKIIAQNFLDSLGARSDLLGKEYQARVAGVNNGLNELNLESGIGQQLTQGANQALAQIATAQAQLDAQAQAGSGKLIGGLIGTAAGSIFGGGFGGLGGGGGTNGTLGSFMNLGSPSSLANAPVASPF